MILNCDGSSRGNPGSAGIGMVLKAPGGKELQSWGSPIGKATNNVAEYKALLAGLKRALKLKCRNITIRSDSQLLVRQLTGEYRVKNRTLAKLHKAAHKLLVEFDNWSAEHVPREENKEADKIAQKQSKKAKKDNS
ncbi:MAG: ribonuclease HI family protein [Planctomycetes bacterium]|nr:ribonuclease HI family protein [Planctomycetota bacterium]